MGEVGGWMGIGGVGGREYLEWVVENGRGGWMAGNRRGGWAGIYGVDDWEWARWICGNRQGGAGG